MNKIWLLHRKCGSLFMLSGKIFVIFSDEQLINLFYCKNNPDDFCCNRIAECVSFKMKKIISDRNIACILL